MDTTGLLAAGSVIDQITALLDRVDPSRGGLDAATRLAWVRTARQAHERLGALTAILVGEADRAHAAEQATGTPLSSWLGTGEVLSRREANAAVRAGRELAEHPELADAAASGRVTSGQSRAIGRVLDELAPQLDVSQQAHAEQVLVDLADRMDADQLRRAADTVLAKVAPADADELLETKLQREHEAAVRGRSFRYWHRGGSMHFEGSLPRVDGAQFIALIDAHTEKLRRTVVDARDPLLTVITPEQRRADALTSLVRAAANTKPDAGLGSVRVVVTIDYEKLRAEAAGAGLIGPDARLSAGELRLLCCRAGLLPAVLGDASEPLDVGRERRLVTAAQRVALTLRDGGCAFPGCDVAANRCEAHHIVPWWSGGRTDLSNLALLCRHHHGLIEPARYGVRDQWEVRVALDGLPEFIPPRRFDRDRRPVRNRRVANLARAG